VDANRPDIRPEEISRGFEIWSLKDRSIILAVSNVGWIRIRVKRFGEWTEKEYPSQVRSNAVFPTLKAGSCDKKKAGAVNDQ